MKVKRLINFALFAIFAIGVCYLSDDVESNWNQVAVSIDHLNANTRT